jgi:hypothetical protein
MMVGEEYRGMAEPASGSIGMFPVDDVAGLVGGVRKLLAGATGEPGSAAGGFAGMLDALAPSIAVAPPAQHLPVCAHFAAAVAAARGTPAQALAAAAERLGAVACWTQNPHYRSSPPDSAFLANYGYFVVAGPADGPPAFVEAPNLAMGFLLLGPGTHYPAHRHPAEEIYIPLSGAGDWRRGEAPWRREAAGAVIHHPSGISHATRALEGPLLALYLWRGGLATHARLDAG